MAKVQARADKWSKRLLRWTDKRTVITYLLPSIIWYRVPVIVISNTQITELTKVLTKFFCHNKQIAWTTLTKPFSEGGFDLPNITDRTRRLQGKLANRLYEGRSQPWKTYWRKSLESFSKLKDPRLLYHSLLEPPLDHRLISQITAPLNARSPLMRQNLRHLQEYCSLSNHPSPTLSLDQILALLAVPNKTLHAYSNTTLLQTNHHRVNDFFNEDTRTFFTVEELAQAPNIRPNILAPLLNRITDNLPNTWDQTLRLSRSVFEPGNWALLENADRQLARHHLFQITTTTDTTATFAWARPRPVPPQGQPALANPDPTRGPTPSRPLPCPSPNDVHPNRTYSSSIPGRGGNRSLPKPIHTPVHKKNPTAATPHRLELPGASYHLEELEYDGESQP